MNETGTPGKGRSSAARLSSLIKRADSLAEHGNYDEAIARVEEALAIRPEDPKANLMLATFYRAQNRMVQAVDAIQRAAKVAPENANVQQLLLRTLIEVGRYDEAAVTSQRLLKQYPRSILARDVLSIVYLQQGRLDQALKVTEELIQLAPTDSANHFKKAVLLQQKGEIPAAMNAFLRSLDMDPAGEMAEDAREAIAALDSYQLRQILTVAVEDVVFRAKLALDTESALSERGYKLSPAGISTLRQLDLNEMPGDARNIYYH